MPRLVNQVRYAFKASKELERFGSFARESDADRQCVLLIGARPWINVANVCVAAFLVANFAPLQRERACRIA